MESSISFKNVTLEDNPLSAEGNKRSDRSKIFSVLRDSCARQAPDVDYRFARYR